MPSAALGNQKIIGIWAANPHDHKGQWAAYCEAWDLADALIAAGGPCPYQPTLF